MSLDSILHRSHCSINTSLCSVPFRIDMKPALSAPAISVPFHVAEDCAGLGTGFVSAQRTIRRLQCSINSGLMPWERAMKFQLKCRYLSEPDPQLRAFIQNKHKNSTVKMVDDCAVGTADAEDRVLGTDGLLDLYMAGPKCQPFSRMGKTQRPC